MNRQFATGSRHHLVYFAGKCKGAPKIYLIGSLIIGESDKQWQSCAPFPERRTTERLNRSRLSKELFMDLNYLFQRHSVSLHMAREASCACSRRAHQGLAEAYAALIDEARNPAEQLPPGAVAL